MPYVEMWYEHRLGIALASRSRRCSCGDAGSASTQSGIAAYILIDKYICDSLPALQRRILAMGKTAVAIELTWSERRET